MRRTGLSFVSMAAVFLLTSTALAYSGGAGTQASPFQIATISDWQQLMSSSSDWADYFVLTNDLNLNAVSLTPVGNSTTNFTGSFNGNGHAIRNASITLAADNVGLFGVIGNSGQIQDLGAVNVNITGIDVNNIGGLCGTMSGTLSNCYSTGSVSLDHRDVSNYFGVGGLCGTSYYGTATGCYSTCTVSGSVNVGGLCGDSGTIINSHFSGSVNGGESVGGLIGSNNGSISGSWADAVVTSQGQRVGGLVGSNLDTISGCHAAGGVDSSWAGGLCGVNQRPSVQHPSVTISGCWASCNVTGDEEAGGLCAENDGAISECFASGSAVSSQDAGGLCAVNVAGINDSYATAGVTGPSAGGLCSINLGSISRCYAAGLVSEGSGGLCQSNWGAAIEDSFWDVETSGQPSSDGGEGETTQDMKTLSTFTTPGWDFATVWYMPVGSYPLLRSLAPPLAITAASLPAGTVGAAYSASIAASGGLAPLSWQVSAGSLPDGLNLNSATGAITGTPSSAGTSNFTVLVADAMTPSGEAATEALSIVVSGSILPLRIARMMPAGRVGQAYNVALSSSGGAPPVTWSIASGSLPAGLALSSDGIISGTPMVPGAWAYTVRVSDSFVALNESTDFEVINILP